MTEPVVERIPVAFSGPGAGTAPLTWGQKAILQDMRATGWPHNNSGAHPVPEGATVEDLAHRLGVLMSRFPVLRMRLATDADGRPCQVICASGEIDLEVATFADDVDPRAPIDYGNTLWREWLMTPLAPHTPWLLRMAVMRHRDAAVYMVLAVNSVVADGTGTLLFMSDLGIGELAGRKVDGDAIGTLELARREQTPQARRVSERAMRYWAGHLRSLPPKTFGEPRYPGRLGERFWHGRFNSPAAYLAVLAIAERTRTDTSRVLLAVIAIAIGRATGIDPLTTNVIVSNRFRPGFAEVIGPLGQDSVLTLDLGGTVDDVVARTRQAAMVAWLHGYYDPDQLDELTARLDAERGHPARITCRYNDRRLTTRPPSEEVAQGAAVTPEMIRAKLGETFLVWDGTVDHLPEQAFINVENHPETVYLQLVWDMAVFTTEQVETLLRGVEEVAIEAAFNPAAPTRVTPGQVSG
ncbi:condensation domain-containing protein [Actinophytocola sp.]|uniref:condensation domain-containing protein n=1 Tax=Actinophytocola sp. TaxID=1872138 RepID=UPI002D81170C|nr:condensation domain-containing protein [Actinophytocola sp.]HET9143125.1 condensation domain-containing protein [Actinophytocola sp.]